ncbi:MAG TPA: nucleoside recognition domain-containing protein, partial [Pyrinomonadaceae bacterium]|nr:nucleoside recognition domain-containing protein [Pyrinomonadaceae bacterium]
MVLMMGLMKLLEAKGVLAFVARVLTPVLKPFGIPGIGVFAILQSLLVSFAAPVATLSIMET